MDAQLWGIVGAAAGELAIRIIGAVAEGEDWEPLVDRWAAELKIKIAAEANRAETVEALKAARKRILGGE